MSDQEKCWQQAGLALLVLRDMMSEEAKLGWDDVCARLSQQMTPTTAAATTARPQGGGDSATDVSADLSAEAIVAKAIERRPVGPVGPVSAPGQWGCFSGLVQGIGSSRPRKGRSRSRGQPG
ncbi:unnamed protein product [Polarella glacialis]|uniref:Uncharacterized protein n=1 Tax=Polarella glacialis TaxID=89957 RepID=A0A813K2X9_POLGL|nr:unnamed protein product [Polarella glacialis]